MSLVELLAQYDIAEDDLESVVREVLAHTPAAGSADLTASEVDFLQRHAGLPRDQGSRRDTADLVARASVATGVEQARESYTTEQAAAVLRVHRTRVSHRVAARELYSFPFGRQRRLPKWQFTSNGEPLPGLAQVLAVLPDDLHPASVAGFMTIPNPDLDGLSPATWLASGGDPEPVVAEAVGLDWW